MPSPFPGMDPYLEHPSLWSSVHALLIAHVGSALNASLPSRYAANIGERLYVLGPDRNIYPDVTIARGAASREPPESGGGAAVALAETSTAAAVDPAWEFDVADEETRESFIEIVTVGSDRRVVCVLEVLSPANKLAGSHGRRLYQQKQGEVLKSQAHLVEIDLLRDGDHTVAAPSSRLAERGTWDYLVSLSRGPWHNRWSVWAIKLRQRLPRIRVPLAGDDPDLPLDLQAAFDRVYDAGAFARQVDYSRAPAIPLSDHDVGWAREVVAQRPE